MKKNLLKVVIAAAVVFPIIVTIWNIISGGMPFWYDPARDFLIALDNQKDFTLIGPPAGIPGIFYGPYWVWLLSGALLLTQDPRIVQLLVQAVPYLLFLSFVLYVLSKVWGGMVSILIWILFMFGFMEYLTYPWNPHLAPLFALICMTIIIFVKDQEVNRSSLFPMVFAGVVAGLVLNFHISFGIGFVIGIYAYFLLSYALMFREQGKNLFDYLKVRLACVIVFSIGLAITYIPFIVFEIRHGFQQINAIRTALLSDDAVVAQQGLSNSDIVRSFFGVVGELLSIPVVYGYIFLVIVLSLVVWSRVKGRLLFTEIEQRMILLVFSVATTVLFIYIWSKNPVWEYHFIGIEILFLLLVGLIAYKFSIVRYALILIAGFVVVINTQSFVRSFSLDYHSFDTLKKKEHIVRTVSSDAGDQEYTVFVYNPGIYTYDFAYLFSWIADKDVPYDPGQIQGGGELIYLVIPRTENEIYEDFIHFRTPSSEYETKYEWNISDGTKILKRVRTNNDPEELQQAMIEK